MANSRALFLSCLVYKLLCWISTDSVQTRFDWEKWEERAHLFKGITKILKDLNRLIGWSPISWNEIILNLCSKVNWTSKLCLLAEAYVKENLRGFIL